MKGKPSAKPRPGAPKRAVPEVTTALTDMRTFYRTTNWAEWWEEWYLSIGPSGAPKYRSTWDFARAKTANDRQKKFVLWYIGARLDGHDPQQADYPFCPEGPQDWFKKREQKGWYSPEALNKLTHTIRQRQNALDALQEAGNSITLNSVARMEQLARRIDESFGGQMFVPELEFKENVARATAYLTLQRQVLGMLEKAQDIYAKAWGINYNDMAGYGNLVAAAALIGQQQDTVKSRVQTAVEGIASMMLQKAHKYGLALPEDASKVIVDTVATPLELTTTKKKVN